MKDYKAIAEKQEEYIEYLTKAINSESIISAITLGVRSNYAKQIATLKADKTAMDQVREAFEPIQMGANMVREKAEDEKEPCPNCKETNDNCACMRNICIRCGKPVGNITFTVCDSCWDDNKVEQPQTKTAEEILERLDNLTPILYDLDNRMYSAWGTDSYNERCVIYDVRDEIIKVIELIKINGLFASQPTKDAQSQKLSRERIIEVMTKYIFDPDEIKEIADELMKGGE